MLKSEELLPLLRQGLQVVGGLLIGRGVVSASEVEALTGLVISAVTVVWMLRARRAAEAVATAPAEKVREVLAEAGLVEPRK